MKEETLTEHSYYQNQILKSYSHDTAYNNDNCESMNESRQMITNQNYCTRSSSGGSSGSSSSSCRIYGSNDSSSSSSRFHIHSCSEEHSSEEHSPHFTSLELIPEQIITFILTFLSASELSSKCSVLSKRFYDESQVVARNILKLLSSKYIWMKELLHDTNDYYNSLINIDIDSESESDSDSVEEYGDRFDKKYEKKFLFEETNDDRNENRNENRTENKNENRNEKNKFCHSPRTITDRNKNNYDYAYDSTLYENNDNSKNKNEKKITDKNMKNEKYKNEKNMHKSAYKNVNKNNLDKNMDKNMNLIRIFHFLTSPSVLIVGGNFEPKRVDIFDIIHNKWHQLNDTFIGREVFFEVLWYQGYIYVFCGIHHSSYGIVEKLNPLTNIWSVVAPLPCTVFNIFCLFFYCFFAFSYFFCIISYIFCFICFT